MNDREISLLREIASLDIRKDAVNRFEDVVKFYWKRIYDIFVLICNSQSQPMAMRRNNEISIEQLEFKNCANKSQRLKIMRIFSCHLLLWLFFPPRCLILFVNTFCIA